MYNLGFTYYQNIILQDEVNASRGDAKGMSRGAVSGQRLGQSVAAF
jgi:hypothetical protein